MLLQRRKSTVGFATSWHGKKSYALEVSTPQCLPLLKEAQPRYSRKRHYHFPASLTMNAFAVAMSNRQPAYDARMFHVKNVPLDICGLRKVHVVNSVNHILSRDHSSTEVSTVEAADSVHAAFNSVELDVDLAIVIVEK